MIFLLLACIPSVKESGTTPEPTSTSKTTPESYTLFMATTDYQVGALASYDVAHKQLSDSLLLTSSDNSVATDGDLLFVMGRSSEDTVRVYGEDLSVPSAEFSTGSATNPQDVAVCGENLVVALYETDYLGVYDLSGSQTGTVDLSAFSDADGGPEPSELMRGPDGFLYVALNHLDSSFRADGPGELLKIDCESWSVVDSWETTPNASFSVDPRHPERLVITGGNYFNDDFSGPDLDGWLQTFDINSGSLSEPLLTEAEYGKNIGFVSLQEDGSMVVVGDDGYAWTVSCLTTDGSQNIALEGNIFVSGGLVGPDGQLWLSLRPGFGEGATMEGLVSLDPVSCHADKPRVTALPPGSMAWR